MPDRSLLIVSHLPSNNLKRLGAALESGARRSSSPVEVLHKPAFGSTAEDVLKADAIVLITPENLGYMSGALKDWFDRIYYPVLEKKQGLPLVSIIRAGHDGTGTERAIRTIATGLRWRWVQEAIVLRGDWQESWLQDVEDLGEALVTALDGGMI